METDPKRIKLDSEVELNGIHESLKNLKDFTNIEIINNNTSRKTICLKGNFSKKDGIGVVLLEKTSFVDSDVTNNKYFEEDCYLEKEFSNDIYGNYRFFPKLELNSTYFNVL